MRKPMSQSDLQEIAARIDLLSTDEKQILLDRLCQHLRMAKSADPALAATLANRTNVRVPASASGLPGNCIFVLPNPLA
jgi:hypothetical protein